MIVLDTNQLKTAAFPHGPVLSMLRKVAEIHAMDLALPEMVLVEHAAHFRHEIDLALTAGRKALSVLGPAFDVDMGSWLNDRDANRAADSRQAHLRRVFRVLPTPPGAAEEALKREANRLPPAEPAWTLDGREVKARGARDVTIWLTLLETVAHSNEDVWFVTIDHDFGKETFRAELHEEAVRILGSRSSRLRLVPGLDALLGELADKAEPPENLDDLLRSPRIAHAVKAALMGGGLFLRTLTAMNPAPDGFYRSNGNYDLTIKTIKRTKCYAVGNIWVSAQVEWNAAILVERHILDEPNSSWKQELSLRLETTVLAEVEQGQVLSAEVSFLGPTSVLLNG